MVEINFQESTNASMRHTSSNWPSRAPSPNYNSLNSLHTQNKTSDFSFLTTITHTTPQVIKQPLTHDHAFSFTNTHTNIHTNTRTNDSSDPFIIDSKPPKTDGENSKRKLNANECSVKKRMNDQKNEAVYCKKLETFCEKFVKIFSNIIFSLL